MSGPVIQAVILKDWRLHRTHILLSLAAGLVALAVMQWKSEATFLIGVVWFFISLFVLGSMLPVSNVINERKKQNLAFLMSLPISALDYAMSKLVSTIGMFLVPWMALVIAGSTIVLMRSDVPNGVVPLMMILLGFPLVGFCVIAGAALISESEGWTVAASIVCNSTYGLAWYFLIRQPAINSLLKSPVPVWSPLVLKILAGEAAAVILILALTFYLQSRKREFV